MPIRHAQLDDLPDMTVIYSKLAAECFRAVAEEHERGGCHDLIMASRRLR